MERVLVTGAGGYVGTTLVPMLLAQGYKVRALDRFFFGGHLLPEHPQLKRIRAEIRRLESDHLQGSTWRRSPDRRSHRVDCTKIEGGAGGRARPPGGRARDFPAARSGRT